MVYDYVITFKRPNYKYIDWVSRLLLFFALVSFGFFAFVDKKVNYTYLVFFVLLAGTWAYLITRKQKNGFVLFRAALLIAAIGWLAEPYRVVILSILYAVAGLIEKQVKFPQEIGFSEDEVAINSFPKKKFNWNSVANAMIKDNMLTVDLKNNKIIQKVIDDEVSSQTEIEFNEFCKLQLNKATVANTNDH